MASAFGHGLCCIATEVFFANDGAVPRLRCRSKLAQKVALRLWNAPTSPKPLPAAKFLQNRLPDGSPQPEPFVRKEPSLQSRLLRPMEHIKEHSHTEAAKRIDE